MNFQNIPRSEKVIKRGFVPKLDAFLFFDYKAIELRVLAFYMATALDDYSLAQEFIDGADPHRVSAQGIYGKDDVTDEERQVGKTVNFLSVYGGGPRALCAQLGVTWPEAVRMLDAFHDARPGIRKLQAKIEKRIAQRGYITTLWGRHLHPRDDHKALNALIQGCSADLMRSALVKTHHWMRQQRLRSHLVSVIHDELIGDVWLPEVPTLVYMVPKLMDHDVISKIVPVETDCEISFTTWADKEPYEETQGNHHLDEGGRDRA